MWVSPVEVENALIEHAAVLEAACVGREDHDGLVKPMAFVVLRAGGAAARRAGARAAAVRRASGWPSTSGRAGSSSSPELPKTATGKIQRFKLRGG